MQRAVGFCLAKGEKMGGRCMQTVFPVKKGEKKEKKLHATGFYFGKGVKMEESCMQQGSALQKLQRKGKKRSMQWGSAL